MGFSVKESSDVDWRAQFIVENPDYLTQEIVSLYVNLILHHVNRGLQGNRKYKHIEIGQNGEVWWVYNNRAVKRLATLQSFDNKSGKFSSIEYRISG